jgi:hypothetical protein
VRIVNWPRRPRAYSQLNRLKPSGRVKGRAHDSGPIDALELSLIYERCGGGADQSLRGACAYGLDRAAVGNNYCHKVDLAEAAAQLFLAIEERLDAELHDHRGLAPGEKARRICLTATIFH